MQLKKAIIKLIPFELKRGTSWVSIVFALILTGLVTKIGELILHWIIKLISLFFKVFGDQLVEWFSQTYEVNLATLIIGGIVFIVLLFPIYRRVDKIMLSTVKKELIFEDDFTNPASWRLNYWGSNNLSKTNRIQNNRMIFEATPNELQDKNHFFGAYFNLKNGIYEGNTYEISCQVKSSSNSTMKFQLWIHDTLGGPSSIYYPKPPRTPSDTGEQISIRYKANKTNAMRIHLHCQGGDGRIDVSKVSVFKVK